MLFFSSLFCLSAICQNLAFEDILKIYGADTASVVNLCTSKNYSFVKTVRINDVINYNFKSNATNLSLEISYQIDTTSKAKSLSYWIDEKSEFKNQIKSFKLNGFKYKGGKSLNTPAQTMMDRYVNNEKDIQIEIITANIHPRYWIILHKPGYYAW